MRLDTCFVAFALALVHPGVQAAGPHEHGAATLHVAIDGDRLQLELVSPLDNLVGFERAPRNDREKAAIQRMAERLRDGERLFVATPDARCRQASVELDSPVLDSSTSKTAAAQKAQENHAKSKSTGHASLEAVIVFRCEQPQKLSGIDVKLFEAFPHLKRVDARVAGAKKQSSAKLTPRSARLSW